MDNTHQQTDDISLRYYVNTLRRRKWTVIAWLVAAAAAGTFFTLRARPVYRTTARILVEGKTPKVAQFDANSPIADIFTPVAGHNVDTQIEVLQSEELLRESEREAGVPPNSVKVKAGQVKETDVIEIAAESNRRDAAQDFLRVLPFAYMRYLTDNRRSEVENALDFSRKRLRDENEQLWRAEAALQKYKRQAGIANLDKQRDERIARAMALQTQIDTTESDAQGLQAQLSSQLAARHSLPEYVVTPTTTNNVNVDVLKDRIANLKTDRERLLVLSKPNDTTVQETDAQIADLERRLASLPATITTRTRAPNPALVAYDAKIDELRGGIVAKQAALAKLKSRASTADLSGFGATEMRLARLTRDVEVHKNSASLLANAVEDLRIRVMAGHNPARVLSPASTAARVFPIHSLNISIALLIGLLGGICTALLKDYFDDRARTPEEALAALNGPILGYIPRSSPADVRLPGRMRGDEALLESYRFLRTNLQFATIGRQIGSLVVSSTTDGEGKSVTASNLAIAVALDSRRVILVDGDLRRPSLHKYFELNQDVGLTSVLSGEASLDVALQPTKFEGLSVLTTGPLPSNPVEVLNSPAMRRLHAELKERADLVIFDSPPFLATADAQVIAADTDGVMYVIQLDRATRGAMAHAASLMTLARARILGLVVNNVADRRYSTYYADASYGIPPGRGGDGRSGPRPGGRRGEPAIPPGPIPATAVVSANRGSLESTPGAGSNPHGAM